MPEMAEKDMAHVVLTVSLPASLVRQAEAQGLRTAAMLEALLRAEVQRRRVVHFFETAHRLAVLPRTPLTEAEVQAEIHDARAEWRVTRVRSELVASFRYADASHMDHGVSQ